MIGCIDVFVINLPYRYLEGVVNKVAEQRLIICVHVFVISLPCRYLEGVVNKVAEQ